jgi:hypothetical protein
MPAEDFMMKKLTIPPELVERVKAEGVYVHMPKEEETAMDRQRAEAEAEYFASVKHLLTSKLPPNVVTNSEGLL